MNEDDGDRDVRVLEIKSQQRLNVIKVITTGVVVTLLPAIIGWQIQNQQVELERVKSEQSYLQEFADRALQDDIHKRYNFADYLATVALSKQSRTRWLQYRDKINGLFETEKTKEEQIIEIREKIDEENNKKTSANKDLLKEYRRTLSSTEIELKQLRDNFSLFGSPIIAPSSEVFTERYGGGTGIRFEVRALNLAEQGNAIWLKRGGEITATIELNHECLECGSAINQIIVGLDGENDAQACVWSGLQSSGGWQPASFRLAIPNHPGTYHVRARYAQAHTCEDALGWWRVDRPDGPTAASNIGAVVVTGSPSGG